jgi:hypothetical protein
MAVSSVDIIVAKPSISLIDDSTHGSIGITLSSAGLFSIADRSTNASVDFAVAQPFLSFHTNDWNLSVTLQPPVVGFNSFAGEFVTLDFTVARPALQASIASGTITYLEATMRKPSLAIRATETGYVSASFSVSSTVSISSSVSFPTLVDAALQAPSPSIYFNSTSTQSSTISDATYVLNVFNAAHSTYTNFGFNSYFWLAGKYYGVKADGIYEITGNVDVTAEIQAEIITSTSSFNKQGMKACSDAFVLGRVGGDISVGVITDEDKEFTGFVGKDDNRTGLHRMRVKIDTGLQGATLQYRIKNMNGSHFSINSLEVSLRELQRAR